MPVNIIDTHIHIWDLQRVRYSWLEGNTSILNRTYQLDELIPQIADAEVIEGILVQAANNEDDTNWMLHNAREHSWITGVVGWLPLTDPGKTAKALEQKYMHDPYFKGVRHLIHNEPDSKWLMQPAVLESLEILAASGIAYDVVGTTMEHLEAAIAVAAKIPGLRMVLDHLNQPPVASGERYGKWGALMKEAAACPAMHCKISGLGTAAGKGMNWVVEDIKPYILYAVETFGPDRCFCGGDWPVSLLAGSYQKIWDAYRKILSSTLSPNICEDIFRQNALKFYRC